jgi:ATP-dependent Zn protease
MEKYDRKFYDYLLLNQNNLQDGQLKIKQNTQLKKLHMINAIDRDSFNKRSNNFIWMLFYLFLLIILIIMVFLFV